MLFLLPVHPAGLNADRPHRPAHHCALRRNGVTRVSARTALNEPAVKIIARRRRRCKLLSDPARIPRARPPESSLKSRFGPRHSWMPESAPQHDGRPIGCSAGWVLLRKRCRRHRPVRMPAPAPAVTGRRDFGQRCGWAESCTRPPAAGVPVRMAPPLFLPGLGCLEAAELVHSRRMLRRIFRGDFRDRRLVDQEGAQGRPRSGDIALVGPDENLHIPRGTSHTLHDHGHGCPSTQSTWRSCSAAGKRRIFSNCMAAGNYRAPSAGPETTGRVTPLPCAIQTVCRTNGFWPAGPSQWGMQTALLTRRGSRPARERPARRALPSPACHAAGNVREGFFAGAAASGRG